jgi:hypothetical protein
MMFVANTAIAAGINKHTQNRASLLGHFFNNTFFDSSIARLLFRGFLGCRELSQYLTPSRRLDAHQKRPVKDLSFDPHHAISVSLKLRQTSIPFIRNKNRCRVHPS